MVTSPPPLGLPGDRLPSGNIEHDVETRIFINKEGNRFVNEGGRRDDMTNALFAQKPMRTCGSSWTPTPISMGRRTQQLRRNREPAGGSRPRGEGDTLEELAEKMNVPADTLIAAVTEFNRHAEGGDLAGTPDESANLNKTPIMRLYAAARHRHRASHDGAACASTRMRAGAG